MAIQFFQILISVFPYIHTFSELSVLNFSSCFPQGALPSPKAAEGRAEENQPLQKQKQSLRTVEDRKMWSYGPGSFPRRVSRSSPTGRKAHTMQRGESGETTSPWKLAFLETTCAAVAF